MPKTRSAKPTSVDTVDETGTISQNISLPPHSDNPPSIFVVPLKASSESQIVTLPHPRSSKPSRYLVCPESGFYEFKKVAAPKTIPRSWLIEPSASQRGQGVVRNDRADLEGQVTSSADLHVASEFDPLFLILSALTNTKSGKGSDEHKRLFLSSEDYFDNLPEESSHLSDVLRLGNARSILESRMAAVCDTVDAGDETMYRLNEEKAVKVILGKAESMCDGGLPLSLEEKFVRKALDAPIQIQKRQVVVEEASVDTDTQAKPDSGISTPLTESNESQSTAMTSESAVSSFSQTSTAATSFVEEPAQAETVVSAIAATPEICRLQRLQVAFDFICSCYIAPSFVKRLEELLNKDSVAVDFTPLTEYQAKLSKLRAEILAARSVGDYTRKRGRDEEEDEARAEKKRKLEEEKKRKASESRGVRDLKKVNTSGMKKMSDFFKKK